MSSTTVPAQSTPSPPDGPAAAVARAVSLNERPAWCTSGWVGTLVIFVSLGLSGLLLLAAVSRGEEAMSGAVGALLLVGLILLFILIGVVGASLTVVQPVETQVVQFLGRYIGTVRRNGFVMVAPLTHRHRLSVRVQNFETRTLKVNDADGNPVELGAIVVWKVNDTARAAFAVEDYHDFVTVQSESALRHVATIHPYDDTSGHGTSLRGSTNVVAAELQAEVSARVGVAGVEILEVRISHLAYSTEIAQAMLQRQQASAIVAARSRIVDGAVGMVEMALARLREHDVVELDEERKAAMVSNLLVVLCGDSRATPVVNTGTLYQ